ncbi:MAG: hypothetical protein R6V76_14390 [Desulfobacterales bacterium]
MKSERMNYCALIFILVSMFGIASLSHAKMSNGNTSIKEVKKETQDLLQTLKAYTIDKRDEAVHKTKAALDNLDKRIEELEARVDESWSKMDKTAREKARANLKALRKQRTKVAEWYGSLKNSTGDAWEHMKKEFSDAYKALNDVWEKSEKEFESGK